MAIAIAKEDRETAKRESLYLFQIMVDARYVKSEPWRQSAISGACSKEQADKLRGLIRKWNAEVEAAAEGSVTSE